MPDLTDIESSTNESAAGEGGMAQGGAVVGLVVRGRAARAGAGAGAWESVGSRWSGWNEGESVRESMRESVGESSREGRMGRGGGQGGGWREGKGALGGDIKEGLEREPGGQEAARRRTGIVKEGDEGEEEGEDGMKGSEEGERGRDEGSIDWLRLSVGVAGCSKESQHQHTIDFMGSSCIDMNESEEDGCMPRGALLASPRGTDSARPRGTASASPRGAALAWPHATCQHALAGSPASSSDLRELVSRQQGQIEELRWLLGQQMEACHALAAALVLPVLTCVVPFEFLSVHSQELVARQQGQIEELRRLLGQQMESCHALAAALRLQQQERQHLGRQGEQGLGGLKETQEADLEETKLGESRSEEADGAEGEEGAEEAGGEREKEVRDSGGGEREGAREWRDLDWDDELMQQSGELRGDITSLKDQLSLCTYTSLSLQLAQRANRIAPLKHLLKGQTALHHSNSRAQLKSRSPSLLALCVSFAPPRSLYAACSKGQPHSITQAVAPSHHGSAQVPLSLPLSLLLSLPLSLLFSLLLSLPLSLQLSLLTPDLFLCLSFPSPRSLHAACSKGQPHSITQAVAPSHHGSAQVPLSLSVPCVSHFPLPVPCMQLARRAGHSSSPFDGAPDDGSAQVPLSLSLLTPALPLFLFFPSLSSLYLFVPSMQLAQRANRIAALKHSLLHTMAQLKSRSPSPGPAFSLASLHFPSLPLPSQQPSSRPSPSPQLPSLHSPSRLPSALRLHSPSPRHSPVLPFRPASHSRISPLHTVGAQCSDCL
ncbi:unnamed protein product [Closterium sp. NIES-65]|nr:unnamed protein product [Closterium sp. NIES-65]